MEIVAGIGMSVLALGFGLALILGTKNSPPYDYYVDWRMRKQAEYNAQANTGQLKEVEPMDGGGFIKKSPMAYKQNRINATLPKGFEVVATK